MMDKKTLPICTIVILLLLFPIVSADYTVSYQPANNASDLCPNNINLCVDVVSSNSSQINITIYSNLSGVWDYFYIGTENVTFYQVPNGSYCISVPFFTEYDTTYYWNVSFNDGVNTLDSSIFSFTTTDNPDNCEGGITSSSWLIGPMMLFSVFGLIAYLRSRKHE